MASDPVCNQHKMFPFHNLQVECFKNSQKLQYSLTKISILRDSNNISRAFSGFESLSNQSRAGIEGIASTNR